MSPDPKVVNNVSNNGSKQKIVTRTLMMIIGFLVFALGVLWLLSGLRFMLSPNRIFVFFYGLFVLSFGCYLIFSVFYVARNLTVNSLEHFSLSIAWGIYNFFLVPSAWSGPWTSWAVLPSGTWLSWDTYSVLTWAPITLCLLVYLILRVTLLRLNHLNPIMNSEVLSIIFLALGLRLIPFILFEQSLPFFPLLLFIILGISLILLSAQKSIHRSKSKILTAISLLTCLLLFSIFISVAKSEISLYMELRFATGHSISVWGPVFISIGSIALFKAIIDCFTKLRKKDRIKLQIC